MDYFANVSDHGSDRVFWIAHVGERRDPNNCDMRSGGARDQANLADQR